MAHVPDTEIRDRLEAARQQVVVGAKYCHYKKPSSADAYTVRDLVLLENSDEVGVLYSNSHLPDMLWVRPLADFLADVEIDGELRPRFTRVD